MILIEKTQEVYGYNPSTDLGPTSNFPVYWKCDKCSHERVYTFGYYNKKVLKAKEKNDGFELCAKCGHAHRQGKATIPVNKNAYCELPPEVDIQSSIERFHADPRELSPWSRTRVVVRCKETGKICTPKRCSLNSYKCIKETGHFYSIGAWTAKRRKGAKASPETLELQKKSQKQRRVREKEKPTINEKVNSVDNQYFLPYRANK